MSHTKVDVKYLISSVIVC